MDLIELARQLGRELQEDERYQTLQSAKAASDADEELQSLIGEFNLKRLAINNEAQKEDRNEETLRRLNDEFRQCYAKIMENDRMTKYNDAKTELDALVQRITAIITLSAEGENPETCDYDAAACAGDCSTCAGCH